MTRRSPSGLAGVAVVLVVAGVAVVGALVFAGPKGKGRVWYAPRTWFSHTPAVKVDQAQAAVVAASQQVDAKQSAAIHSATVEANKTVIGAAQLPASQNAAVVQRTAGNTFGILNQISPLTVEEQAANEQMIWGLLSTEAAKRETAEAAQKAAEAKTNQVSRELEQTKQAKAAAEATLAKREADLRAAFDDRNAKANELEAESARKWILLAVAAVLLVAAVYFRSVVGSVGNALHFLEPVLGPQHYNAVVSQLDSELGSVAQWAVRAGKSAAAKKAAKAKAILSGLPTITPGPGSTVALGASAERDPKSNQVPPDAGNS